MYRVYPQVTRLASWVGPAPLANGHLNRTRLLIEDPLLPIGPAFAQVVDVCHRDHAQPLVALITIVVKLAVENFLRGRPAHHFVRLIHRCQQLDILGRITIGKPVPPVAQLSDRPAFLVATDQSRDLRSAQSCHLADVAPQHSLYRTALLPVLLLAQRTRDPLIYLLPVGGLKLNLLAGFQKRLDLLQVQPLHVLHAYFQFPACRFVPPSGSFCVRIKPPLQAHSALDKTVPSSFAQRVLRSPLMPTDHIIAQLIAERDKLNRAIEALQGPIKRRGRPPKNPLSAAIAPTTTPA